MQYISKSENQSIQIAQNLAKTLKGGEVILMSGDLGAGKTAFTKGIAKGLGIQGIITSPTFTILNVYNAKINLYHFDMYRIEEEQELYELGFNEYIGNPNGVCVVEWHEKTPSLFEGTKNINICIKKLDQNTRAIIIGE